jgi:hypothetical protein
VIRWQAVVVGALTFLVSHVIEVMGWPWFDPAHAFAPWFLNAGRAVAFTAACLLVAVAIEGFVAATTRMESAVLACNIAAGAVVGMAVVLAARGPGTLFPIALAIGALVALGSAGAGALVGWSIRQTARAR